MAEDDLKITVLPQQFSIDVMLEKYAKGDETRIDDIYRRVARGVALAEPEARRKQVETEFFENFQRGALGAGRIMSAAGTGIQATLINCFVQPVGDAIQGVDEDGLPGIYVALAAGSRNHAARRRGGLQLFRDPSEGCARAFHGIVGVGAVQLHGCVRRLVQDR